MQIERELHSGRMLPAADHLAQHGQEPAEERGRGIQLGRHLAANAHSPGKTAPAGERLRQARFAQLDGRPQGRQQGRRGQQMPFGHGGPQGCLFPVAHAQRAHAESVAAVAVEMDLDVQRGNRVSRLPHEALEGDRQAEPMPGEADLAVVQLVPGASLVQMMLDGGQGQLIAIVDHGPFQASRTAAACSIELRPRESAA